MLHYQLPKIFQPCTHPYASIYRYRYALLNAKSAAHIFSVWRRVDKFVRASWLPDVWACPHILMSAHCAQYPVSSIQSSAFGIHCSVSSIWSVVSGIQQILIPVLWPDRVLCAAQKGKTLKMYLSQLVWLARLAFTIADGAEKPRNQNSYWNRNLLA